MSVGSFASVLVCRQENTHRTSIVQIMETLRYGCVTQDLGLEHFAKLRTAYHNHLLRSIGFQRRQRTDHHHMRTPRLSRRHNVRAVRRLSANDSYLLLAGAVQRTTNERLPHT